MANHPSFVNNRIYTIYWSQEQETKVVVGHHLLPSSSGEKKRLIVAPLVSILTLLLLETITRVEIQTCELHHASFFYTTF